MSTDMIEELFSEALEHPPEQRANALSNLNCSDEVKNVVRQLIASYERSSSFFNNDLVSDLQKVYPGILDTRSCSDADTVNGTPQANEIALKQGDRIGNYVVEDMIGSGGMSVVFHAKQSEPIQRDVAIKLLRPSNSTKTALMRFVREQQAVAILRHPNICSLYEVTHTENGDPVAVMELVRGKGITTFCDRHRLNWKDRVKVFLMACRGLSHAHQRGVVHRDIKPDNILVAIENRKPLPKLIDFGIASIKRTDFSSSVALTQTGQWIGTPRYMSPEQFQNRRDLDHRTDIYSAALVLFELLAGEPFQKGDTANELIQNSSSDDPERLSRRIRKIAADKGEDFFGHESSDALSKFASKDLDWILTKALAHAPQDRYDDMKSFATDVRAAIQGKPVYASAPSLVVRTKKFVMCHQRPIWISASLAIVLLLGLGLLQRWRSGTSLYEVRLEQTQQVEKTEAANDLVMRLLASDRYQLTSGEFDLDSLPAYRAHYRQIQKQGGPKSKEDKFVYGILAVMEAMDGDFDQAETLMEAADVENSTNKELRVVRDKICEKYAQAAKIKLGQLETKEKTFEKATQQMILARCYFVWGMYDDGEQLLTEAIDYFESKQPSCYESLVARLTLIRILQRSGKTQKMKGQLTETLHDFSKQRELLSTDRGKAAWSTLNRIAGKGIGKT